MGKTGLQTGVVPVNEEALLESPLVSTSNFVDMIPLDADERPLDVHNFMVEEGPRGQDEMRRSKLSLLKTKRSNGEKLYDTIGEKLDTNTPGGLVQCPHCPRKFNASALERHVRACVSVFGTIRTPAVDFRLKRAKNTPLEHFVNKALPKKKSE